jgi:hypothetical protein
VLDLIKCLNQIWDENGVQFTDLLGISTTMQHSHYRVVTVKEKGHHGFVELLPNFRTIDDIENDTGKSRVEGMTYGRTLIPSSVATFITGYAPILRDRHKGNMGVSDGFQMANIDFGWWVSRRSSTLAKYQSRTSCASS